VVYFLLIGVLLAAALRRNPLTLPGNVRFQVPYLILGCLAVQLGAEWLAGWRQTKIEWVVLASFVALMYGLWRNRGIAGVRWIMAGLFLNIMALALNGGFMPVSARAMEIAGLTHLMDFSRDSRHQLMTESHVGWLGDWIPFLTPVGTNYVFSPGDIAVGVGLIVLIVRHSSGRRRTA